MRHHHTATAVLFTAVLTLTACSNNSHRDAGSNPTTSAGPTTSAVATTSPAAVQTKLSTVWGPRIDAFTSVHANSCVIDAGSRDCENAVTDAVDLLGKITSAAAPTAAGGTYDATVQEIQKLVTSARAYTAGKCFSSSETGTGSVCRKDATGVTLGMATLRSTMTSDETNAGL